MESAVSSLQYSSLIRRPVAVTLSQLADAVSRSARRAVATSSREVRVVSVGSPIIENSESAL